MWLLLIQNSASALTIILSKAALRYASPFFYIGSRMTIGGLILLACYYALYRKISIDKKDIILLVQIMFFQLYLSYLCDIYAISQLSAARVSILYALAPFIAAVFSYFIFSERMTIKKVVGMAIGFIGIVPMATLNAAQDNGQSLLSPVGGLLLFGVVCNTYGYIILRVLVKKRNYSPLLITAIAMLGAGICTLVTAYFFESKYLIDPINVQSFMLILLSVIVVGNIIAYGLNGFLLKKYTATFIAFAGFLYPLFGALFGWIFFGEPVTYAFFFAIFMVIIGLYIFYHEELRLGYYH